MDNKRGFVGLLLLNTFFTYITGDQLNVESSPAAFAPLLTPSLRIRCVVTDTSHAPTSGLVGRSVNKRQQTGSSNSSQSIDVSFVSSLILMKDGVDLGSVTEHTPPRALVAQNNVDVTGSISPDAGERAFLLVTIRNPTTDNSGNYQCQLSGYDDVGHSVTVSRSVEVTASTPTLNDVVYAVYTNKLTHEGEIAQLKAENTVALAQMQAKFTAELANMTVALQQQQVIIASLSAQSGSAHMESGVVDCGTVARHPTYVTRRTSFQTPYTAPPTVHAALLDARFLADTTAGFKVTVTSVDESGFTLRCSSDSPTYYAGLLRVSWLSLPAKA